MCGRESLTSEPMCYAKPESQHWTFHMFFRLQTGLGQLHGEISGNVSEHVQKHLACSLLKRLRSMADKTVELLLRG